jgi:hypothetical protein
MSPPRNKLMHTFLLSRRPGTAATTATITGNFCHPSGWQKSTGSSVSRPVQIHAIWPCCRSLNRVVGFIWPTQSRHSHLSSKSTSTPSPSRLTCPLLIPRGSRELALAHYLVLSGATWAGGVHGHSSGLLVDTEGCQKLVNGQCAADRTHGCCTTHAPSGTALAGACVWRDTVRNSQGTLPLLYSSGHNHFHAKITSPKALLRTGWLLASGIWELGGGEHLVRFKRGGDKPRGKHQMFLAP